MKILIVDDLDQNLIVLEKVISKIFKNKNIRYQLSSAYNGKEALEQYSKDFFDLVFTDIRMPIMNGFELSEKLLEIHPKAYIVAVTAEPIEEVRDRAINIGLKGIIEKPISKTKISSYVNLVMNSLTT